MLISFLSVIISAESAFALETVFWEEAVPDIVFSAVFLVKVFFTAVFLTDLSPVLLFDFFIFSEFFSASILVFTFCADFSPEIFVC